ncbi:hypothetical protein M8S54_00005, partial [Enterobacter asburiae]|nr:hypothetical protein [Enterobacter asburiae]
HGDVLMWLMKTLLTSGCTNQRGAGHVDFRFIGDYIWTLKVSDSPRLRLPFVSDPKGVKRESGLKKYITISATPASENVS